MFGLLMLLRGERVCVCVCVCLAPEQLLLTWLWMQTRAGGSGAAALLSGCLVCAARRHVAASVCV